MLNESKNPILEHIPLPNVPIQGNIIEMAQNPRNLMQDLEKFSLIFTRLSTYRNPKLFLIVQYNF